MASVPHSTLHLPPLAKQTMAQLLAGAKRIGLAPEAYAKQLVEDALSFQAEAERSTFAQIMDPVRQAGESADEAEIVKLVQKARTVDRRNRPRKKR